MLIVTAVSASARSKTHRPADPGEVSKAAAGEVSEAMEDQVSEVSEVSKAVAGEGACV